MHKIYSAEIFNYVIFKTVRLANGIWRTTKAQEWLDVWNATGFQIPAIFRQMPVAN